MTDERMALKALLEKTSDADLLNEMIGFAANRLMALEADALCNAVRHERTVDRINYRNGYVGAVSGAGVYTVCARNVSCDRKCGNVSYDRKWACFRGI